MYQNVLSLENLEKFHKLDTDQKRLAYLVHVLFPDRASEFLEQIFCLPTGAIDEVVNG